MKKQTFSFSTKVFFRRTLPSQARLLFLCFGLLFLLCASACGSQNGEELGSVKKANNVTYEGANGLCSWATYEMQDAGFGSFQIPLITESKNVCLIDQTVDAMLSGNNPCQKLGLEGSISDDGTACIIQHGDNHFAASPKGMRYVVYENQSMAKKMGSANPQVLTGLLVYHLPAIDPTGNAFADEVIKWATRITFFFSSTVTSCPQDFTSLRFSCAPDAYGRFRLNRIEEEHSAESCNLRNLRENIDYLKSFTSTLQQIPTKSNLLCSVRQRCIDVNLPLVGKKYKALHDQWYQDCLPKTCKMMNDQFCGILEETCKKYSNSNEIYKQCLKYTQACKEAGSTQKTACPEPSQSCQSLADACEPLRPISAAYNACMSGYQTCIDTIQPLHALCLKSSSMYDICLDVSKDPSRTETECKKIEEICNIGQFIPDFDKAACDKLHKGCFKMPTATRLYCQSEKMQKVMELEKTYNKGFIGNGICLEADYTYYTNDKCSLRDLYRLWQKADKGELSPEDLLGDTECLEKLSTYLSERLFKPENFPHNRPSCNLKTSTWAGLAELYAQKICDRMTETQGKPVVFSNPTLEGKRVDWCLRHGEACGKPAADEFCKLNGYQAARDYKTGYLGHTYLIGARSDCGPLCDGFVEIQCANKLSTLWQCPEGKLVGSKCLVRALSLQSKNKETYWIDTNPAYPGVYRQQTLKMGCPEGEYDGANCVVKKLNFKAKDNNVYWLDTYYGGVYRKADTKPHCEEGWYDGVHCVVKSINFAVKDNSVYWLDTYYGGIYRRMVDGSCPEGTSDGVHCVIATIDFKVKDNSVYWIDTKYGGIYRNVGFKPHCEEGTYDGANCVVKSINFAVKDNSVYWIDTQYGGVYRKAEPKPHCEEGTYDGVHCVVKSINFAVKDNSVYWLDTYYGGIYRRMVDGSCPEGTSDGVHCVIATIDFKVKDNNVYWIDTQYGGIYRRASNEKHCPEGIPSGPNCQLIGMNFESSDRATYSIEPNAPQPGIYRDPIPK